MQFSDLNLNAPLLKALDEMGLHTPTTIQARSYNIIMSGKDVCGIAQTGTGKTLAYLLPSVRMIEYSKHRFPQMLILVPTRELVTQVVSMAEKLCSHRPLTIVGVYGGVNMKPQADAISNGADILVATPGRLYDHVMQGTLGTKYIKKLVIDEVDEMLALGFRHQLKNIIETLPDKRQNLMFSATITSEVTAIIGEYFNEPEHIEAAPTGTPLENISQTAFITPNFNTKINLLKHLLDTEVQYQKILIFAQSKKFADKVYEALLPFHEGDMGIIHSNKAQNQRFQTVEDLKSGSIRFVIATDIIARGIDIDQVDLVINFDLPDEPEHYMHRIGRTGRAKQQGMAISFLHPQDAAYQTTIEQLMRQPIPVSEFPEEVEISTELIFEEIPKVIHKEIKLKEVKRIEGGAAFHEKKAKNMKTPGKGMSHKDKMMLKYGKPKSRGAKKKR